MNLYSSILALLTLISVPSIAQNVLTEDFIFDPVDSLEKSGDWERSGINTEFNIKISAPGLEYKDYIGSARGNTCKISNNGNGDIVYRNFSSEITSGSAYMSFMFQVDSLPDSFTEGYCISFNPNTGGTNLNTALHVRRTSSNSFQLGIRKLTSVQYGSKNFDVHKTYLIVLKYTILAGSNNDSSSVYVFSDVLPQSEPNQPHAASTEGDDYTGQASVYLNNNYAQDGIKGCDIKIDGIRVGTSWETSVWAPLTYLSNSKEDRKFGMEFYPNPFQRWTKIRYQIPSKGMIKIQIFNGSGNLCEELFYGIQEAGTHELPWNANAYPFGNYTCRMEYNGHVLSKMVQLAR